MRYRRLGESGLLVSELALGTMVFGEDSDRGTAPAEARGMIDRYLDAGGNHFDVANVYAGGRAEAIVGEALHGRRQQAVLTTKVRWPMGHGPNEAGLSRYHIRRSVEDSLRRLRTDVIDVLYMHGWDPLTPLEETLGTFEALVTSGKVQYIGISNLKAWHVMKALSLCDRHGWVRPVAAQYQYSLVVRDIEAEFLDLCESEGLGLIAWGPLGGGFLSGKYRPEARPTATTGRIGGTPDAWEESWERRNTSHNWNVVAAVDAVVAEHPGRNAAQVALAWILTRPAVASVVIGARTLAQLEGNLAAADLRLTPTQIDRLDEASSLPAAYPYRGINSLAR